jgi:hypothetical protein
MAKFALINKDPITDVTSVVNIIVADNLEETLVIGTCVEFSEENPAGIGWIYDEKTGKFSAPVTEEPNA